MLYMASLNPTEAEQYVGSYSTIPIPLNKIIKQGAKTEVFAIKRHSLQAFRNT